MHPLTTRHAYSPPSPPPHRAAHTSLARHDVQTLTADFSTAAARLATKTCVCAEDTHARTVCIYVLYGALVPHIHTHNIMLLAHLPC
jgi:hypothetical protein